MNAALDNLKPRLTIEQAELEFKNRMEPLIADFACEILARPYLRQPERKVVSGVAADVVDLLFELFEDPKVGALVVLGDFFQTLKKCTFGLLSRTKSVEANAELEIYINGKLTNARKDVEMLLAYRQILEKRANVPSTGKKVGADPATRDGAMRTVDEEAPYAVQGTDHPSDVPVPLTRA